MRLGIMQPYFLPYIGYWQLINAVDKYVIYDDVNYIKNGWINRNRILVNGKPKYFNVPMLGASSYKFINQVAVNNDPNLIQKNLRIIDGAYKKAPYYQAVYPLLEQILMCEKNDLASYIEESIHILCNYLDIKTEIIMSSTIDKNCDLKGQDKVLEICKLMGATEYYNAIGGQELYSFSEFRQREIQLKFLKTHYIEYKQFENEFQSSLSILDVMMFCSKEKVKFFLEAYNLISE